MLALKLWDKDDLFLLAAMAAVAGGLALKCWLGLASPRLKPWRDRLQMLLHPIMFYL